MRSNAALGFALLAVVAGCQAIAGIEERHFEEGVQGSLECEDYCDKVLSGCQGANAAYPDRKHCILTCANFRSGEISADNSLECRAEQARQAIETGEPGSHCPAAGIFGADKCGSTCSAYCSLLGKICPDKLTGITDCNAACAGLPHDQRYDLSELGFGDDIECRMAYLMKAAVDPKQFCGAANFKSDKCVDPAGNEPSCEEYCNLIGVACVGQFADYESKDQCMAVCAALPKGTNADIKTNTIGCRKYHSYNSLTAPETHCAHAGPGGDGLEHCGQNCEAYCFLAEKLCPNDFTQFGTNAKCREQCGALDGAKDDTWKSAALTGNSVRCRMRALARTADGTPSCSEAFGTTGTVCAK